MNFPVIKFPNQCEISSNHIGLQLAKALFKSIIKDLSPTKGSAGII